MEHIRTFPVGNCISSEIGVRIWLIMDISFFIDGWSYSWNPGRIPGRSGQWFSATATTTSKSGQGYYLTNRTPQLACAGSNGPLPSAISRPR
jgi:hypothetical protein